MKIKIKIHPAAIVLAAFFIWDKSFLRLLLSVILHELCHSLAAFLTGRHSQVLTLSPLGCSLYVGEMGGRARQLFVYLAGPIGSLLLCPFLSPQTLWIFAFNSIPVLPLDLGRVLCMFIGERRTNFIGGLALLCALELCLLNESLPTGIIVILILHSRYIMSARLTKIRRAADFLRDLY